MTKQKYVIVGVHPDDAYFDKEIQLAGTIVTLGDDVEDYHGMNGYVGGHMYPINPDRLQALLEGFPYFIFIGVKLQTLEDHLMGNDNVYQVGH